MFRWLRRGKPAALSGAPTVRRQKTYAAESGYVYQYYYLGQRTARGGAADGTKYVFDVTSDRKNSFPVTVFLSRSAIEIWQREHTRELTSTETYAVAKMALFHAFDERPTPQAVAETIAPDTLEVGAILASLNID